ncbi:MAG: hypothetical protein ACLP0J_17675 [Solirubrobacteraceae bacterium]
MNASNAVVQFRVLVEGLELGLGLVGVEGGVDRFQVAGDLLTLRRGTYFKDERIR